MYIQDSNRRFINKLLVVYVIDGVDYRNHDPKGLSQANVFYAGKQIIFVPNARLRINALFVENQAMHSEGVIEELD